VLQQNVLAKSLDKQYEITYSITIEFNTTMALTILTEQRDFIGAGVGQNCGCETVQGDRH